MPVDLAILYCAKEVMRTLLLSGADINHRYHHHLKVIMLLLLSPLGFGFQML